MVRVLVKDDGNRFEVWDGDNRKLHDATDFYEAVLNALPKNKLAQLGYRPGQGVLQAMGDGQDRDLRRSAARRSPPRRSVRWLTMKT